MRGGRRARRRFRKSRRGGRRESWRWQRGGATDAATKAELAKDDDALRTEIDKLEKTIEDANTTPEDRKKAMEELKITRELLGSRLASL